MIDDEKDFKLDGLLDLLENGLPIPNVCKYCGMASSEIYCTPACEKAHLKNRRARLLATGDSRCKTVQENFTRLEIFLRDKWVCQICGKPIDKELEFPNPMSPTLDHAYPVSLGGPHTRGNVRAAHLICNLKHRVKRPRKKR